jgi:hypothetical protein
LATKLVDWDIDIRNEEELKREIAKQMGEMMASGAPVPLSALQVVNASQTADLKTHGIDDIDKLAAVSVDDLVEWLDISLDEAESILSSAQQVVEARNASADDGNAEGEEDDFAEETVNTEEENRQEV